MIAQIKPPIQDRSLTELRAMGTQAPNSVFAGLQLLVGYEWLLSGGDKLLIGVFPASLGALLHASINSGQLPGFFAALLQGFVAPNAVLFGCLIEWGEILAGLGLMAAGLLALLRPLTKRFLTGTSAVLCENSIRLIEKLAPLAAIGAGLLGLSFFFLDGMPSPWFVSSIAYDGAINTGLFLAVASAILVVGQFMQRYHRG